MRLLIKNGMVYDGLGHLPVRQDLLIKDERIERIGDISGREADQVIDAAGKVVTPGFVDIHRHCDIKPFTGKDFGTCMLAQGITTVVAGNCGISMSPCSCDRKRAQAMQNFQEAVLGPSCLEIHSYREYLHELEKVELPVNMAAMLGTGSVKITVKGFADTPYTDEEMQEAVGMIEDSLKEGAPGVSVGIMYLPECYSTADEFVRLLRPVGEYGGVAAFHIRGEGDSMVESVREVLEIGRKVGCAVEISHFKSCGVENWRKDIHRAIALIEEARGKGQDVTVDFYPYEGGATALTTMLPPAFVKGDLSRALVKLGSEEGVNEFRRLAAVKYKDWDNYCLTLGWERILISSVEKDYNRKFLGMTVSEAAERYGYADAYALAGYLMHDEEGKTAVINMSMCQEDIDTVAGLSYSMVISDSIYADTATPHPRMYGAFPKIIREYVREREVLTMEDAIRKMTSLPAVRMRLVDRGVLEEGRYADINIFDPEELRDNATFRRGAALATGIEYCIVNGRVVYQKGESTGIKAGKVLKVENNGNLQYEKK